MNTTRVTFALLAAWFSIFACGCEGKGPTDDDTPLSPSDGSAPPPFQPGPSDGGTLQPALDSGVSPVTAKDAGPASSPSSDASQPQNGGSDAASVADSSPPTRTGDAGDAATMPPAIGTPFPAVTDAWQRGPFSVATQSRAGPARNATVFYPMDLGKDGLKHPIVIWDNGAGQTGTSIYGPLVQHLASHGFAVYHAYESSDGGKEITDGLDWMIAENARSGSPYFGKLDPSKTAAMGHSRGSIAAFAIAADPRLTTTLHLSGGTNPEIAEGHKTLANLRNPSAFLCGEPGGDGLVVGDTASEWCAYDFDNATVPVFLTQIKGASHISAPSMMNGACAGWLRWRLMGDSSMKKMFAGADCSLCKRQNWVVKQRGLDDLP